MRKPFVLLHRYVGLAITVFLTIVGLTGSVLAFYHELDRWLNPELLRVRVRDTPMLDPITLRERAEALEPRARIDQVSLERQPAESYSVSLQPRTDPATGKDYALPYTEFLLDPYTGEKLGARKWGAVSLAKENILSFLYRLHFSLALPESTGNLGLYILGITALVWSLDCFVGVYLTLPPGRRKRDVRLPRHAGMDCRHPEHRDVTPPSPSLALDSVQSLYGMTEGAGAMGRFFWSRWKPAWLIKKNRFNYDLHRASGLWVWPMLFVLAWSSVAFNLNTEIYRPVLVEEQLHAAWTLVNWRSRSAAKARQARMSSFDSSG